MSLLHANEIIHRDIKLNNVLISEDGPTLSDKDASVTSAVKTTYKLGDFGSAVMHVVPGTTAKQFIGTMGYIAPEMLLQKGYGKAVDVYSLGALMHVLLSHKLPFLCEDRNEYHRRLRIEELDLSERSLEVALSSEAKDLLRGMLQRNPSERLSITQVLSHPWLQL